MKGFCGNGSGEKPFSANGSGLNWRRLIENLNRV